MKKAFQTLFLKLFTVVIAIGQDVINIISGELNTTTVHHRQSPNISFQSETHLKSSQTIKQRLDSVKYQAWNDTTKLWTYYYK